MVVYHQMVCPYHQVQLHHLYQLLHVIIIIVDVAQAYRDVIQRVGRGVLVLYPYKVRGHLTGVEGKRDILRG